MFSYSRKKSEKNDSMAIEPLALEKCLAKTWKLSDDKVSQGRDVYTHCLIVAGVAQALIDRMPQKLAHKFFPSGSALVAGEHDIGKISPTFQHKIYGNLTVRSKEWDKVKKATEDESQWGGHAGVSQSTIEYLQAGSYIPQIIGQHHGFAPCLGLRQPQCQVFGGKMWLDARTQVSNRLKQHLGQDFPTVRDPLHAKLLAGLTTVADWIGSGCLFDDPAEEWAPKIQQALDWAGFIPPTIKCGLSFEEIFDFEPREIQTKLINQADRPGVYLLEAPMGVGKTEAALYAAYRCLEKGEASGIYFALPTQLTSEKIYERMAAFLQKIFKKDSPHNQPYLLHSNAWLKLTEMGEDAQPGRSWFSQKKRGILAPFAVGTVDQALMAVLNVRHGFVRAFGLMGKVVILDEVHTYDAYTGTIMDELVEALRRMDCTVIILSATLTQKRRQDLLRRETHDIRYPLVTGVDIEAGNLREETAASLESKRINISIHAKTSSALEEAIRRAEAGQQILWIENTVSEAQDIYFILSARARECGVEVGLLHSRFIQQHRQKHEGHWVSLYGKEGWRRRNDCGRILVGTQVLEQSLDIDADFLITRMAPTDMLLQRMGRLWRHDTPNRCSSALPETCILAPELVSAVSEPEEYFGKSAKVYMPYVLCRSLEVWQTRTSVTLPDDIRTLIEETYRDRPESGEMGRHLYRVEQQRNKLSHLALMGLSSVGQAKPDERVTTRYSETDGVDVLMVRKIVLNQRDCDQLGTWVTFLDGETVFLPHAGHVFGSRKHRELAAQIMRHRVGVAEYAAPSKQTMQMLSWLKDYVYLGHPAQMRPNVRVGIVKEDETVTDLDGSSNINDKYRTCYSTEAGYRIKK